MFLHFSTCKYIVQLNTIVINKQKSFENKNIFINRINYDYGFIKNRYYCILLILHLKKNDL